jgi:hypothetical protein
MSASNKPSGLLRSLHLGEPVIASVSGLLASGDVPNVLWGNYLLTVYGVPSLTNVYQ